MKQLQMLSATDRHYIEHIKSLSAKINILDEEEKDLEKSIYSDFLSLPEDIREQVFYNNFGYKTQVCVLRSISNQIERSNEP